MRALTQERPGARFKGSVWLTPLTVVLCGSIVNFYGDLKGRTVVEEVHYLPLGPIICYAGTNHFCPAFQDIGVGDVADFQ